MTSSALMFPAPANEIPAQNRGLKHAYYLSNRPHFLWVCWCNKPTRDVGRTREKLVNHSPAARDLQAFLVFSQHPKWVYYTSKPIENAVYCFYEITRKKTVFLVQKYVFNGDQVVSSLNNHHMTRVNQS